MREYGFSLTPILQYKGSIFSSYGKIPSLKACILARFKPSEILQRSSKRLFARKGLWDCFCSIYSKSYTTFIKTLTTNCSWRMLISFLQRLTTPRYVCMSKNVREILAFIFLLWVESFNNTPRNKFYRPDMEYSWALHQICHYADWWHHQHVWVTVVHVLTSTKVFHDISIKKKANMMIQ